MATIHESREAIERGLRDGLISQHLLRGQLGEILFAAAEGMEDINSVLVTPYQVDGYPVVRMDDETKMVEITFIHDNYFVEDLEDPAIRNKLLSLSSQTETE